MKNVHKLVGLLLLTIVFTSCNNDNITTSEIEENSVSNTEIADKYSFKVETKNEMLSFPTREDYDMAIEYLGALDTNDYITWENSLGFTSMRKSSTTEELEEIGVVDELLATLINPNAQIEIANNVFTIDLLEESVTVITSKAFSDKTESADKKVTVYSTDDDVLDIIEGIAEPTSIAERRYCKGDKKEDGERAFLFYKIVYQRAGILNSLQSKVLQKGNYLNLGLRTNGTNNFWKNKKGSGKIGPYSTTFFIPETKSYRPYYSSRRLKSFYFSVEFLAQDKTYEGTEGITRHILTISCN